MFGEPARDILLRDDAEVIVCGAGPAGVAAAIMAARAGARTQLLEVHGCLGGVWTAGMLTYVFDADKAGINKEIMARLEERAAIRGSVDRYVYHPEEMKLLLEEMCAEAGVKVRLFTRVVAAHKDAHNRLQTIVTESPSGREAWRARAFIDTTGDGALGTLAGCAWEFGESKACPCQPMTMNALITVDDSEAMVPFVRFSADSGDHAGDKTKNLSSELARAGVKPSYTKPTLFQIRGRLLDMMINHEYGVNPFDADQLTQATLNARREIHRTVRALRALGGPWSGLELVATSEQIGVRDGRRILGRYQLTKDDIVKGTRFEDGVALVTFNVDIHAAKPGGPAISKRGIEMKPYHIPLRALIAKDVDGLMMAGRCISGDFIAHASYRVTGNAVAMGEAVGVVSALAAQRKALPHEIPWAEAAPVLEKVRSKRG